MVPVARSISAFSRALSSASQIARLTGDEGGRLAGHLDKLVLSLSVATLASSSFRGAMSALPLVIKSVQAALTGLGVTLGVVTAGFGALILALHELNRQTGYAQRGGKGLAQVVAEQSQAAARLAEALAKVSAATARTSAATRSLTLLQQDHALSYNAIREGAVQAEGGIAALARQELIAAKAAEAAAKAAAARAKAAAELARAIREEREELEAELIDESNLLEITEVLEPAMRRLAEANRGLIFDVRDAGPAFAIAAQEAQDFADAIDEIRRSIDTLDIDRMANQLGGALQDFFQRSQAVAEAGPAAAFRVVATEAERSAQGIIALAEELAEAAGPELAMAMIDRAIPGFEKLGEAGNKAILLLLQALSRLGQSIRDLEMPTEVVTAKIVTFADKLKEVFGEWGGFIGQVIGRAQNVAEQFFDDLAGGARSLGEAFVNLADNVGRMISSILSKFLSNALIAWLLSMFFPGLGGFGSIFLGLFGITKKAKGGVVPGGLVPALAGAFQTGGIVHQPSLAMIGEGSRSEAVVPLPDNRSIPVKFTGDGEDSERPIELTTNIAIVMDPSQLAGLGMQPDQVITIAANDVAQRGTLFRAFKSVVR